MKIRQSRNVKRDATFVWRLGRKSSLEYGLLFQPRKSRFTRSTKSSGFAEVQIYRRWHVPRGVHFSALYRISSRA